MIASYLAGQTVLVTGAGGSIGAELCRQIARVGPERIMLVEHAENALVEIERELVHERRFPRGRAGPRRRQEPGEDAQRSSSGTGPSVVFHAAAYKHVPLMEANPLESVRNNVVATAGRGRGGGRVRRRSASCWSRPTRR